jgi:carbamoyl-phosphate synthase large subunit
MVVKLKVLRTGAGSPPSPPIIDALITEGCEVVVADADPLSFGLYHYKESAVIPTADDEHFVPNVLEVCKRFGVNVIIPTVDEELPVFARERERFAGEGIEVVVSDLPTIASFDSKLAAYETFTRIGVGTPKTSSRYEDIDPAGNGNVVVKPDVGRGAAGVHVARGTDAERYAKRIEARGGVPVYQELAEGTEYTVDALCDLDGKLLCGAVRERLQTESGIAIKSRVANEPEIWSDVERITSAVPFRGPINVQCIKTRAGGRKWFDLNPRYAGTAALSIAAGAPIVRDLVRVLRGEEAAPTGCVTRELYMFRYWREEFVEPGEILKRDG